MFRKHALKSGNYHAFDWTTEIWLNSFSVMRDPEGIIWYGYGSQKRVPEKDFWGEKN